MMYVIISVFGLIIGSFFGVLVDRWGNVKSIMIGRSNCSNCHHQLAWYDLVPLFSFLMLQGKCRYCRKSIGWRHVLYEIVSAIFFVAVFKFGGVPHGVVATVNLLILVGFLLLSFFDLKYFILPDVLTLGLGALALVSHIWQGDWQNPLFTGLLLAFFFAILYVVSAGRWLGFGDIKLIALIGFFLGYPLGMFAVILGIWSAALCSLPFLATKRLQGSSLLPFGTFLSVSTIIIYLAQHVFDVYARFFI